MQRMWVNNEQYPVVLYEVKIISSSLYKLHFSGHLFSSLATEIFAFLVKAEQRKVFEKGFMLLGRLIQDDGF